MIQNPTLRSLLTANIVMDEYNPIYRKLILANAMLLISAITLFFFMFYNIFVTGYHLVALFDAVAGTASVFALWDMRKTKQLDRGAAIGTANLFIFMIALTAVQMGTDFSLIWTIFLPLFAILVLGRKKGLIVTLLFYAILLTMAFQGIGVWQEGAWNTVSFIRFTIASVVLCYIVYSLELSYEKAYEKLEEVRKKEREQMRQMEQLAITDPLTTLYNRRHLDAQFRRSFRVAKLHDHYFGLFVIDLDYFKRYNDLYGHQMGDYVLQEVAGVLKSNMCREADSAFRLGGEEFSGLMISDSVDKIIKRVEKIRSDIESLAIIHATNTPFKVVTASFGVCIIHTFEEECFDLMYKLADDALYRAKDEGRNRVVGGLNEVNPEMFEGFREDSF